MNIEFPDIVAGVHERYLRAGVDGVITNTFGANRISLKRHGHENEVRDICLAGAEIARKFVTFEPSGESTRTMALRGRRSGMAVLDGLGGPSYAKRL